MSVAKRSTCPCGITPKRNCKKCKRAWKKLYDESYNGLYYQRNRNWIRRKTRKYKLANPDKVKAITKNYTIKRMGLTVDEYDSMLEIQRRRCAICRTKKPGLGVGRRFCIDHCHRTGKIRGLLCNACNTRIDKRGLKHKALTKDWFRGRWKRAIRYLKGTLYV